MELQCWCKRIIKYIWEENSNELKIIKIGRRYKILEEFEICKFLCLWSACSFIKHFWEKSRKMSPLEFYALSISAIRIGLRLVVFELQTLLAHLAIGTGTKLWLLWLIGNINRYFWFKNVWFIWFLSRENDDFVYISHSQFQFLTVI